MDRLIGLFKLILIIWGVVLFVNAPDVFLKIIGCAILGFIIWTKIKNRRNSILEKRKAKEIEKYNEEMSNANKSACDRLVKQFNVPISKAFNYAHEKFIFVSEVESLIMVDGFSFKFEQLLACDCNDDQRVYRNTVTEEKKKQSSFLDYMINTDVGRIVDAINAPVTRTVNSESMTFHDYTLKLTLNSLSNPYLLIRLGGNEEMKDCIKGVFDVIIHRNRKKL